MAQQAKKDFQRIPLTDRGQLVDHIRGHFNGNQLIGLESEKITYRHHRFSGRVMPANFGHIEGLLQTMYRGRDHHDPIIEINDFPPDSSGAFIADGIARRHLIGLIDKKTGSSITIEPASQLELSAAPYASLRDVERELRAHLDLCRDACELKDMNMLTLGAHPTILGTKLPQVPKRRYQIILDMFNRQAIAPLSALSTAACQINLDIADDRDFTRKFQAALGLQPIVTALFANSPFEEGIPSGFKSVRNHYWLETRAGRSGSPSFIFDKNFGLERWVDFIFDDVPMMAITRDGAMYPTHGGRLQSFVDGKYKNGYMPDESNLYNSYFEDRQATMADALDQCTVVWTEVRPTSRGGIECRGADNGPPEANMALAALWVGILYDEESLAKAHNFVMSMTPDERSHLLYDACRQGLHAELRPGLTVRDLGGMMLGWAKEGLERRAAAHPERGDEVGHLKYVMDIVNSGKTLADKWLDLYNGPWEKTIGHVFRDAAYWPELLEVHSASLRYESNRIPPRPGHGPSHP